MRYSYLAAAGIALFALHLSPARGQEARKSDDLRKEIEKELDASRKSLLEKVSKVIADQEARIASLEKSLQARDKEIAELKKKLEAPAAAPKPVEPAKAEAAAKPRAAALLGVAHEEVDAETRGKLNLKEGQGAKVTSVEEKSPAASAGLKEGDVILSLGGKDVSSAKLRELVRALGAGEKVDLVYLHGAEKVTRSVELADREKFLAGAAAPAAKPEPAAPKVDSVVLGLLIEETDAGLTVQNVEAGKTGAVAGIKEGDLLLSFNSKKLKKLEDLTEARDQAKVGQEIVIEYKRKDAVHRAAVIAAGEKGEPKLVKQETPAAAPAVAEAPKPAAPKSPARLGVEVTEENEGLRVLEVRAGGAAALADIRKGDLIRELGGQKLKTIDELKKALAGRSGGEVVAVVITRGGENKTLEKVKLGGSEEPAVAKEEPKPAAKAEEPKPKAEEPKARPRGTLGVLALETDDLRLVISAVTPKGPADKAGIKKDDVILKVNGVEIKKGFLDLEKVLAGVFAGDTLKLTLKRGEETKEVEVQLGAAEAAPLESGAAPSAGPAPVAASGQAAGGVYVGVAILEEVGVREAGARLTIDEVHSQSPAARAGLQPGDQVLSIDGQSVSTLDEIGELLGRRRPGQTATFRLGRSGRTIEAGLTLQEGPAR